MRGARVYVEWDPRGTGYRLAFEAATVKTRPPRTKSARDGSFALVVSDAHRELYGPEFGRGWLNVEKPGFVPWREPLPTGLRGYLGSEVTLRRPLPNERLTIERRGVVIGVRRAGSRGAYRAIACEDTATVVVPVAPSPPLLDGDVAALGWEARSLWPTGAAGQVVQTERDATWTGPTSAPTRTVTVEGSTAGLRGLVLGVDGVARWVPGSRSIPISEHARLLCVAGSAARATGVDGSSVCLQPSPSARRLRAVGADGVAVAGLEAWVRPLEQVHSSAGAWSPPRRVRVSRSELKLLATSIVALELRAPGHRAVTVEDPRGIASAELEAVETRTVEVWVGSADGTPIAGASVFPSDGACTIGTLGGLPAKTDGRGIAELVVRSDQSPFTVVCSAPGFTTRIHRVAAKAAEATVTVERAIAVRILTVDAHGRPVPFVPLGLRCTTRDLRGFRWANLRSDSRGRLSVPGVPERATLEVAELGLALDRKTMVVASHEVVRVTCRPSQLVIARTEPTRAMRWELREGGAFARGDLRLATPVDRFAMRWVSSASAVALLGIGPGPSVIVSRVTPTGGGVLELDRRQAVRRVTMPVSVPVGIDPARLIVVPKLLNNAPRVDVAFGRLGRGTERGIELELADAGAIDAVALHPELVPVSFRVPAGAEDLPALTFARGGSVAFRMPAALTGVVEHNVTVSSVRPTRQFIVLRLRTSAEDGLLTLPCALPAGRYRIDAAFGNRAWLRRRELTVHVGQTVTLEVAQ